VFFFFFFWVFFYLETESRKLAVHLMKLVFEKAILR